MTIKGAQGPSRAGLLLTLGVLAWAGAAQAQSLDEIIEAAVAATGGTSGTPTLPGGQPRTAQT